MPTQLFRFGAPPMLALVALAVALLSLTRLSTPAAFPGPASWLYGGGWTLPAVSAVLATSAVAFMRLTWRRARRPAAPPVLGAALPLFGI